MGHDRTRRPISAGPVAGDMSGHLAIERRGTVAILRFENAERMNSFDPATLRGMHTAITGLVADEAVRGIVITGSGKVFCAGADIAAFQQGIRDGTTAEFVLEATAHLHPMLRTLHLCDKAVVAAVNGVAAGGGLGLALAADARIGTDKARFAASYFGIGVSPDGGSTWLLPRIIGPARTRRFFFDNEVMGADEAMATGLMDRLVDEGALLDEAVALAERWGAWASHSRRSTKRLLASAMDTDFATQLEYERGLIAGAVGTADFREGIAAFTEKRKPDFA